MKTHYLVLAALVLVSLTAAAQQNCAYTYTWNNPSFSFCITSYGTVGMIQAPAGTNHLDPTNPVEGFAWYIDDGSGGQMVGADIPGLGKPYTPDTVEQPGGPGTLPLIFTWSPNWSRFGGFRETIAAHPAHRTITLKVAVKNCGTGCPWSGYISRVAAPKPDGNSVSHYGSSEWAGFAYLNHGLMLSVSDNSLNWCGGIDPAGPSSAAYETCGGSYFTGTGAIYGDYYFSTRPEEVVTFNFTYGVF